jgi:tripartite-type tricarboxylate transporter receptor subunit TctC
VGNPQHLVGEYLSSALKLDMVHVPSRGGGQAVNDLVGGQMPLGILGLGPTLSHVKSGGLIPLAVTVGKRIPQLPEVPTLAELGIKDFVVAQWFSLVGPSDMPDALAEQLSKAVAAALDDPAVRQRFEEIGFMVGASTPQQLRAKMEHDAAMWKAVIQERNIKIE